MTEEGTRTLLVQSNPNFKITIPADAKVTFAPFSPPSRNDRGYSNSFNPVGTLRIYKGSKENVIGVFTGVEGFRDITNIEYAEEVAREEGAILWKADEGGYQREEKVQRSSEWVTPAIEAPAEAPVKTRRIRRPKADS